MATKPYYWQVVQKIDQLMAKDNSFKLLLNNDNLLLHLVATSKWLRFKDDVVVRLKSISPKKTQVDIRSSSRIGRSDFNENYKRIQFILSNIS